MKKYFFYFLSAFLLLSCSSETVEIDTDLRFAINTAPGSRGLSSFILPKSDELSRIPQDPNNPLSPAKVKLGQLLFHESAFGTVGKFTNLKQTYSCASCHNAEAGFQSGRKQGLGDGAVGFGLFGEGRKPEQLVEMSKIDAQALKTPSILNVAYQSNLSWNGQMGATGVNKGHEALWPDEGPLSVNKLGFEGVETEAIAGLELHRHLVDQENVKKLGYTTSFDQAFANIKKSERYTNVTAGLAIAAYLRTLVANESPFQQWLRGNFEAMSENQKQGALLFFTKANCINCHNGPNLANMDFHALGMSDLSGWEVINLKEDDPVFLGRASFTKNQKEHYRFKVPQLYNLKDSPFYGHGANFESIRQVLEYKNAAIVQNSKVPPKCISPLFKPLELNEAELDLLSEFIENALYDPNLSRYTPSSVLSGSCMPNNDWLSRQELGCK